MKAHYTLDYLISKIKLKVFETKHPNAPWLTHLSIDLLAQLIKETDIGLEFGSGRSTKWLAERCAILTSVEHHEGWYNTVKSDIDRLANVTYSLKSIEGATPIDSEYYKMVNNFDQASIDFCLVDGKHRMPLCVSVIDKLRVGGLLVLDNAERYLPNGLSIPESMGYNTERLSETAVTFLEVTKRWRRIWTDNGVTATLIMFKP